MGCDGSEESTGTAGSGAAVGEFATMGVFVGTGALTAGFACVAAGGGAGTGGADAAGAGSALATAWAGSGATDESESRRPRNSPIAMPAAKTTGSQIAFTMTGLLQ